MTGSGWVAGVWVCRVVWEPGTGWDCSLSMVRKALESPLLRASYMSGYILRLSREEIQKRSDMYLDPQ